MGELIFTFAYGSSLIVMGVVTRFFLKRMEAESLRVDGVENIEGVENTDDYIKVVQ